jgi:hypothetical protein
MTRAPTDVIPFPQASEMHITNLTSFYKSDLFTKEGFVLDRARKVIVKTQ